MFGSFGETKRHHIAGVVKRLFGDIAEEGLVKRAKGLILIGQHVPCGRLALKHAQVIVRVHERAREAAEENANLKLRHLRVAIDDAPFVGIAIEEQ